MQTVISKENRLVTLINVFTVEPQHQQQLVDILVEATEKVMRDIPGFISANIHKSDDGAKVVNYAQWESKAAFETMLRNEQARSHMVKAEHIARPEPHLYDVSYIDHK